MPGAVPTDSAGTAFNENGNRPVSQKTMSVAIRYRKQEPFEWSPPEW